MTDAIGCAKATRNRDRVHSAWRNFADINMLQHRQMSHFQWVSQRCGSPTASLVIKYGL